MQGHRSNSFLLPRNPLMTPLHCSAFVYVLKSNMGDVINSVRNVKKVNKYEDKVKIKKAGRPKPIIDFAGRGCR